MNSDVDAKLTRAVTLHRQGQPAEAASLYIEILEVHPRHPDALHLLGVTETQRGRARAGLDWIEQSLAANPNQPAAIANQGNALLALGRTSDALASFEHALRLAADYAPAVFGRGNALSALGRPVEALACFDRALELAPDLAAALNGRGGVLLKLERPADSLATYDRAIELAPGLAQAHLGRGSALLALKAYPEALRSIDRALELAPESVEALIERGHVQSEQGDADAAIEAYDRALELNAGSAPAWFSRGLALSLRTRFAEAARSLQRALDIDVRYPYAQGACLHAQLQICDWTRHAERRAAICESLERNEAADFPFSYLAVCDSPPLQLRCARQFGELQRTLQVTRWAGAPASRETAHERRGRIRVAYISADFLDHPTSYLMAGLFEQHDRQRFETIAVSLRNDADSPTARRVKAAFERVVEAGDRTDDEVARLIHDLDVDIAVDLMGYTGEHRTTLFRHRPAPIQVNYLGFPGTMGRGDIDYLIADEFVIPQEHRAQYSEQIAYLPDSFQSNDDRKVIATDTLTRAQAALPERDFVFCSFHSSYKLNPALFDVWARLLLSVPDSVLWLLGGNAQVEDNLRREARHRGVDAGRLVFGKPLPYPHHLARLRLADLGLDTVPFNGGSTSSDALWAGLPILTCAGQSFAARMTGSLLHALGMTELVTYSLPEYEQRAVQLARDPSQLASARAALARNRSSSPLFRTDRFRLHLEAAFTTMVTRHRQGLPPATFKVPPCTRQ